MGCSPWGHRALDRTEELTISGMEAPEEQDFYLFRVIFLVPRTVLGTEKLLINIC